MKVGINFCIYGLTLLFSQIRSAQSNDLINLNSTSPFEATANKRFKGSTEASSCVPRIKRTLSRLVSLNQFRLDEGLSENKDFSNLKRSIRDLIDNLNHNNLKYEKKYIEKLHGYITDLKNFRYIIIKILSLRDLEPDPVLKKDAYDFLNLIHESMWHFYSVLNQIVTLKVEPRFSFIKELQEITLPRLVYSFIVNHPHVLSFFQRAYPKVLSATKLFQEPVDLDQESSEDPPSALKVFDILTKDASDLKKQILAVLNFNTKNSVAARSEHAIFTEIVIYCQEQSQQTEGSGVLMDLILQGLSLGLIKNSLIQLASDALQKKQISQTGFRNFIALSQKIPLFLKTFLVSQLHSHPESLEKRPSENQLLTIDDFGFFRNSLLSENGSFTEINVLICFAEYFLYAHEGKFIERAEELLSFAKQLVVHGKKFSKNLNAYAIENQLQVDELFIISKFRLGASHYIRSHHYNAWVKESQFLGSPAGFFVIPASEADEIQKRAKYSGDLAKELEISLGMEPGSWAGSVIRRIDVELRFDLNPRLPFSSHPSANAYFVLGGRTSGGCTEIILNRIHLFMAKSDQTVTHPLVGE